MQFASLTVDAVLAVLAGHGVPFDARQCVIERRDERWLVRLGADHLAWFPASDRGLTRLRTERTILRALQASCAFSCPRVLAVGQDDDFDIRSVVPGSTDPWTAYLRLKRDAQFARALGSSLGSIIAEQHLNVRPEQADWLPLAPDRPQPRLWIQEMLPLVVRDRAVHDRVDAIMRAYDSVEVSSRVLVHSDLGLHNIAMDTSTGHVQGVFDYASAAWADPHHDFRYLVFDFEHHDVLDAAVAVYESATGTALDRGRVHLFNAACAASYLAFRVGVPPHERHCGRTLQEDLDWFNFAYERSSSPMGRGRRTQV